MARFQATPKETHVLAVKNIFRYLKGTIEFGLWYTKRNELTLLSYTDADWEGSIHDRKSTSGATLYLGDCLVSWSSKKNLQYPYRQQKHNILQEQHVVPKLSR